MTPVEATATVRRLVALARNQIADRAATRSPAAARLGRPRAWS